MVPKTTKGFNTETQRGLKPLFFHLNRRFHMSSVRYGAVALCLSCNGVLWCMFMPWRLLEDALMLWEMRYRTVLCVVKMCGTASAIFKVSWWGLGSKSCRFNIGSDKQKRQPLWEKQNNHNVSKSTSSLCKRDDSGRALMGPRVNTTYHLETIWAGSVRHRSWAAAGSLTGAHHAYPQRSAHCRHCSVMQSGANFHEVFKIRL